MGATMTDPHTDAGALEASPNRHPYHAGGGELDPLIDTTELTGSELGRSRAFIERIAQAMPHMVFVFDLEHNRHLYVNGSIESTLGYAPGQFRLIPDAARPIIHPEDLPGIEALMARCATVADGEIQEAEYRARHADGSYRWLLARATAFARAPNGRVRQIIGIATDITAQKATEIALAWGAEEAAEREEALFALAKATPVAPEEALKEITRTAARLLRVQRCGVWLLSPDGQRLESECLYLADRAVHERAGPLSALLFPDYFRLLAERKVVSAADAMTHPATRAFAEPYLKPLGIGAMLDAPIWRAGRLAGVLCHEYVGRPRTWTHDEEALASALADNVGRVLEEHDRKRAEEALRESEKRLRLAIEAAGIGTYVADLQADRVRFSPELLAMVGLTDDVERTVEESLESVHPDDLPRARASLDGSRDLTGSGRRRLELRIVRPTGEVRWLSFSGQIEFQDSSDGRVPSRLIGACIDITHVKADQEKVRLLNAKLEQRVAERTAELAEANLQLTDRTDQLRRLALELTRAEERERRRIAQVLHDQLQQLLVGARLHADLIPRSSRSVRARVAKVTKLIDESIKASRSLTEELSPPVLHLVGLVEAFQWLARWMAQNHQLTVEVKSATHIEPDADGISALLFLCGRELLFNVVKHSGVQAATLTVERAARDRIRLTIADQGHGFDAAEYHADPHAGFGLFSIRERLQLLGGDMSITSVPGAGTSVTLEAPLPRLVRIAPKTRPADESSYAAPPTRRSAGTRAKVRVLLVDDHKILREGLVALLRNQPDLEVVGEAEDGHTAIQMVPPLQPHVVLMDIDMPVMNGIEATRRITADYPAVRVIGLSMHGDDSADAMRAAGAVAFVHKGARAEEMLAAIRAHAPKSTRHKARHYRKTTDVELGN